MLPARGAPEPIPPSPKRAEPSPSDPAPPETAPATPTAAAPAVAGRPSERLVPADSRQSARIRQILKSEAGESQRQVAEARTEKRRVMNRLQHNTMRTKAYPHFPDYEGARVGTRRILDMDGVPEEAVKKRYDIRILKKWVDNSPTNYLNSVASGGSVYRPATEPGYYEVFELSEKVFKHMSWLENQWLVRRGYDPKETLVDEVEFGLVRDAAGQWDLGIRKLKVQELARVGRPELMNSQ